MFEASGAHPAVETTHSLILETLVHLATSQTVVFTLLSLVKEKKNSKKDQQTRTDKSITADVSAADQ